MADFCLALIHEAAFPFPLLQLIGMHLGGTHELDCMSTVCNLHVGENFPTLERQGLSHNVEHLSCNACGFYFFLLFGGGLVILYKKGLKCIPFNQN